MSFLTVNSVSNFDLASTTQYEVFSPRGRVLVGAFCGLLMGTLYAVSAGTIDLVLISDVPLRSNLPALALSVGVNAFGGAVVGGITCRSENPFKGMLYGSLALMSFSVVQSLIQPAANLGALFFAALYVLLPLVLLNVPITGALRWAMRELERALEKVGSARHWVQGRTLALLVIVSLFAGSWAQMPESSRTSLRRLNDLLQTTLREPSPSLPSAFRGITGFRERASLNYQMTQQTSISFADGLDVRVYFQTGLVITCVIDNQTRTTTCVEGEKNPFGRLNPNDQR